HLLEVAGAIAEDPSVVRRLVAVARERDIDHATAQHQRRALVLPQRDERYDTADRPVTDSRNAGRDDLRTAELFASVGDVERVQPVNVRGLGSGYFFRLGDDVQRVGRGVDDGRAGNPNLGRDVE